jgi:hypothetical protein
MKKIEKILTFTLLAVFLAACTMANAASRSKMQGEITVFPFGTPSDNKLQVLLEMPDILGNGEKVNLRYTLTNNTNTKLYILKWYTPLEGIGGEIFRVEHEGHTLPYEGILASRALPSHDAYVLLSAGESVSAEVDLATAYDFTQAGDYTIKFLSPQISHVAQSDTEMVQTMSDLGPVEMLSNIITVNINKAIPAGQ